MAQDISTAEGIVYDANYPKNYKIVDGATKVGAKINQDIIQFFQKLLLESNIIPNGLDDNDVNTYQLVESLYQTIRYNMGMTESIAGVAQLATFAQLKAGTDTETSLGKTYSLVPKPSDIINFTGRLKVAKKVLSIWNCQTTTSHSVAHGLTATERANIVSIRCMMYNNNPAVEPLAIDQSYVDIYGAVYQQGLIGLVDNNVVNLNIKPSGIFNTADYGSDANFNRGHLFITYIPD
jgi:hypothetical protein